MRIVLCDREQAVLRTLRNQGPMTVDAFVADNLYVNTWAPVFSRLKRAGLIDRTGERHFTRYGGTAHVLGITKHGVAALGKGAS